MQQPSNTQALAEALAAFSASRSAYESTSDQALSQLLVSLAEEVIALRRQLATAPTWPEAAQSDLASDLAALQAQLAALQSAYDFQQVELERLRALAAPSKVKAGSLRSEVVSPPREMRPMVYWEQHVPDYGDATAETDLVAYRSRLRVRPEDVVLSAEDLARLKRRRPLLRPQWVTAVVWIIALVLLFMILNNVVDIRGLLEGLR
jgi:hypothetical protein